MLAKCRTTTAPVVGWPPIRSFRRNLAGATKPTAESPNGSFQAAKIPETERKGLFVKINMDGIPIGRKIDLMACDSYDKLSSVVDELFRGLVAGSSNSTRLLSTNSTSRCLKSNMFVFFFAS